MAKEDKKLGFSSIKAEAAAVSSNKAAQQFVDAAATVASGSVVTITTSASEPSKERMLVVEGYLKDRGETCQKPIQLYLRNSYAEWMQQHASSGRGGQQILINYLIRRGIDAVERDYQQDGIIFATETTDE